PARGRWAAGGAVLVSFSEREEGAGQACARVAGRGVGALRVDDEGPGRPWGDPPRNVGPGTARAVAADPHVQPDLLLAERRAGRGVGVRVVGPAVLGPRPARVHVDVDAERPPGRLAREAGDLQADDRAVPLPDGVDLRLRAGVGVVVDPGRARDGGDVDRTWVGQGRAGG